MSWNFRGESNHRDDHPHGYFYFIYFHNEDNPCRSVFLCKTLLPVKRVPGRCRVRTYKGHWNDCRPGATPSGDIPSCRRNYPFAPRYSRARNPPTVLLESTGKDSPCSPCPQGTTACPTTGTPFTLHPWEHRKTLNFSEFRVLICSTRGINQAIRKVPYNSSSPIPSF